MENRVQNDISLKPHNTFGMDVRAEYFAPIESVSELQTLLADPVMKQRLSLILGGGSNVLLTQNIAGLVIKINTRGIELIKEDDTHVWLKIAAGENWHDFVMHCVTNQYAGAENLSLIPGTVGAAPMQNIGAYGVEIKEIFHELTAMRIDDGTLEHFDTKACRFGYRNSVFKDECKGKYIITDVTLRLNKQPRFNVSYGVLQQTLDEMHASELSIKTISDAVMHIRQNKLPDPKVIGNAGSFFKNPEITIAEFTKLKQRFPEIPHFTHTSDRVKIPAAWMIEQCGYKGKRVGNIGVHDRQALVLVNHGNGEGAAIKQLANEIQQAVLERFAIHLMPEVSIIL